ncbi:hypothetical protein [uncultured Maricaulis sp.]|uniref:hypothetical protein n=1 Tax=uncultured Maricaulis sp. TaxID=174710 RepID=UPI00260AF74E|nr:hypothetical protein [uncultured Maricaulis sp.]
MKTTLNIISLLALGGLGASLYFGVGDDVADHAAAGPEGVVMATDTVPVDARGPEIPLDDASDAGPDDVDGEAVLDPVAGEIVYSVSGTQSGYFIANEEIRFGDLVLENIELWPALPECDEPAYVRLALEDTSDQLGENEYGPYFRLYAMTIDSAAITDGGVMITASDPDIGRLVIEADYVTGALAEWQSGADSVSELLVGTATLNGDTQPASFAFWVGD